jgi:hypothetical protein
MKPKLVEVEWTDARSVYDCISLKEAPARVQLVQRYTVGYLILKDRERVMVAGTYDPRGRRRRLHRHPPRVGQEHRRPRAVRDHAGGQLAMAKKTATEQRLDDLCDKLDEWGRRFEAALEKHERSDTALFTKHDERLTELEREHWKFSGKTALLAFILTLLSSSVSAAIVSRILR